MHRTERPRRQTVPINLILDGRPALVVGGGQVGRRKVMSLLDAGAGVELVCPEAVEELSELAAAGRIGWTRREWRAGDAAGHMLVFACTDDKHVNRAVLDDARAAHVPCCCADLNWADGDFTTPATVRVGDLAVAVSTSGQDCAAARDAKNEIAALLDGSEALELIVMGTSDALLPSRKRAPYHLPSEERMAVGRLVARVRGAAQQLLQLRAPLRHVGHTGFHGVHARGGALRHIARLLRVVARSFGARGRLAALARELPFHRAQTLPKHEIGAQRAQRHQ